ncbi:MAG: hypothetical protein M3Y27_23850 [Acidobacteriota bacterium]|nr:hypothetical protein [Acidobacteriota bacterium]
MIAKELKMDELMSGTALQLEISFLNHRLDVIDLWPDSPRKSATRHAICVRLLALGCAPGSVNHLLEGGAGAAGGR